MKAVIYGAGGPVAAAAVKAIESQHHLRVTDLRADALSPYSQRHECRAVDVSKPQKVIDAAEGMDAIINCTVNRPHPIYAWDVNCRGAHNVMKAAVVHGIKKIVHTGPQLYVAPHGYMHDWDVSEDSPSRPGTGLYGMSKHCGQEIVRAFAEAYDLQVITLVFSGFRDPHHPSWTPGTDVFPYTVSWDDTGEAFRLALEAPPLPRNFEIFHIIADLPHGKYPIDKAKRLLGFQPKDNFEAQWRRNCSG